MKKLREVVAGGLCLLTIFNGVSGTPAAAAPETGLSWQDCGDGLQCAEVAVPSDWARPDRERITLALAKLPARDAAGKRGVLLMNLGGPQAQISAFRQPAIQERVAELRQWFDVVIFDPRGFEASSGISCPLPAPAEADYVFPNLAAFEAHAEQNARFGRECAKTQLAGKLDSWQVAHDLDAVRTALGERKLDCFGNSYGTVYAQAYADLFPGRVGRMYLDSVMDHTNPSLENWLGRRARANERNLHRFAGWCAAEPRCALHGRDVLTVWDELVDRAGQQPIPGGGTTVSATKLATKPVFPPDPSVTRIAICADFPYPGDYQAVRAVETSLRAVAPRLGWRQAWIWAMNCARLPGNGTFPPHRPDFGGLPPVLVVGGEHDDNTPPAWGRHLAGQLPGARYLAADGDHAVYLDGNACARAHVHRYLTTGRLPPRNTVCA